MRKLQLMLPAVLSAILGLAFLLVGLALLLLLRSEVAGFAVGGLFLTFAAFLFWTSFAMPSKNKVWQAFAARVDGEYVRETVRVWRLSGSRDEVHFTLGGRPCVLSEFALDQDDQGPRMTTGLTADGGPDIAFRMYRPTSIDRVVSRVAQGFGVAETGAEVHSGSGYRHVVEDASDATASWLLGDEELMNAMGACRRPSVVNERKEGNWQLRVDDRASWPSLEDLLAQYALLGALLRRLEAVPR